MQPSNTFDEKEAPDQAGRALRLFWMYGGNAIVFSSLAVVAINELAFPTALDGVVWLSVALTILARRLDIIWCHGTMALSQPATLAYLRRHALTMVVVTAAASVAAHMVDF